MFFQIGFQAVNKTNYKPNPKAQSLIKTLRVERNLTTRNHKRLFENVTLTNISSYYGLVTQHGNCKFKNRLDWHMIDKII